MINNENNYKEYSENDINRFIEISTLRQLDIPIKSIKNMFSRPEEVEDLLHKHLMKTDDDIKNLQKTKKILELCLQQFDKKNTTKQLETLKKSLEMDAKERKGFMKEQLYRIFPGMFGKVMVINYGIFLNEPINTEEKEKAWAKMVNMLDDMEQLELPQEVNQLFERMSKKSMEEFEC